MCAYIGTNKYLVEIVYIRMTEYERIEDLHQKYISLKENTPWKHRDGEECRAYHSWYDAAYAYFKSLDFLLGDTDFDNFMNAEKEGNCFDLEGIYNTISPSYKVLMSKIMGEDMSARNKISTLKTPMVFISHSSKDKPFVEALVNLLESMGFDSTNLFCSSVPDFWIGLSQNIFESLRKLFHNHELYVIFVQSPRYYDSPVSLNEMGAAWVLKNDSCSLLTKDMTREQMRGIVDGSTIFIKVDTDDAESRMSELKSILISKFGLPDISDNTWERKRNAFLCTVNAITYEETITGTPSAIDNEFKQLQIEKMRREAIERKQAMIRGNIVESRTRGNRSLKILNSGKATARDVSVEWLNPDSGVIVQWEFGMIGEITPQNSRSYHITLTNGHPETMRLRYTWADNNKEDNLFEEELQI